MGRGGGSRAAGAMAHMEMGEVFKTAGFRVREAEARGLCRSDADRDDARRAVEGVADGLVAERHENTTRGPEFSPLHLDAVRRPACPQPRGDGRPRIVSELADERS